MTDAAKTPTDLTPQAIAEVLAAELGGEVREEPDGWLCRCPVHEDNEPSLLIDVGKTVPLIYTCRAGCEQDDIKRALMARKLYPRTKGRQLITAYRYYYPDGSYAMTKARFIEDGKKTFISGIESTPGDGSTFKPQSVKSVLHKPLYNAVALANADADEVVFIVEGEKDVDNLTEHGYLAVCNHDGAGGWEDRYNKQFAKRNVIILPDNDSQGRDHAKTLIENLKPVAAGVKVLELPDLPDKGDYSDWLEAGGTDEAFDQLVENAAEEVSTPWRDRIITNDQGVPLAQEVNGKIFLEHHPDYVKAFAYDTFLHRIVASRDTPMLPKGKLVDDTTKVLLGTEMQQQGLRGSVRVLTTPLEAVAIQHQYDSCAEEMDSLEAWDGVKRLDTWIDDYCGLEDDQALKKYVSGVGRRFLIAGVARAYATPDNLVKFDESMILEGPTGCGKTTLVKEMNLKPDWFGTLEGNVQHDDTKRKMLGRHVMEVAELTTIKKADNSPLKSFFSALSDEWIEKYKETKKWTPRRCVFVGTHNPDGDGYLNDPTGARRYNPVPITGKVMVKNDEGEWTLCIDIEGFKQVVRQLWAEAREAYLAGERWHTLPGEGHHKLMQDARFKTGTLGEEIDQYLTHFCTIVDDTNPKNLGLEWEERPEPLDIFFPHNFWRDRYNEDYSRLGRSSVTHEISNYMTFLGWEKHKMRNPEMPGRTFWGFKKPLRTGRFENDDFDPEGGKNGVSDCPISEKRGLSRRTDPSGDVSGTPQMRGENAENTGWDTFGDSRKTAETPSTKGFSTMSHMSHKNKKKSIERDCGETGNTSSLAIKSLKNISGTYGTPDVGGFLRGVGLDAAIGLDIETTALRPGEGRIRTVQLWYGGEGVFVDVDRFEGGWSALADLLRPHSFVVFNAQFEFSWFAYGGLTVAGMEDAKLAYAALYGGTISLQDCVMEFLGEHLPKGQQRSDWDAEELSAEQIEYAMKDAEMTRRLWEVLVEKMDSEGDGVWDGYWRLMDAVPCISAMERCGMPFDVDRHHMEVERCKGIDAEALSRLEGSGVPVENWNSPAQVQDWLRDALPVSVRKLWPGRTTTGKLSVSGPVLREAVGIEGLDEGVRGILLDYLERQSVAQLLKTFGESLGEKVVDGRLHGSFQISGAKTGRMSSSRPNLQNMPRGEFRRIFRATEGRKLVVADYSQIEVRVGGLIAGDEVVAEQFRSGYDIHRATAALMFGVAVDAVTDEQRRIAKSVTFGQQYGMGDAALAKQLGCSVSEAAGVRDKWEKTYAGIAAWREETAEDGIRDKVLFTAGGRRIGLTDRPSPSVCFNYPVQGAAADVMYAALSSLWEKLEVYEGEIDPCAVVHDEVVLECDDGLEGKACELLEAAMTEGFLEIFPGADVTGLVEANSGQDWKEAK